MNKQLETTKNNGGDTSKVQTDYNKEKINFDDLNTKFDRLDVELNEMQA